MTNIILSASQQRNNHCAVGDTEADHCQLIADKTGEILKGMSDLVNVYVIPTQSGDDIPALRKVVNLSNIFSENSEGMSYHLDIHSDAGAYATGASALYLSEAGKSFVLPIFKKISEITPWDDIGVRQRTDLMVLNSTQAIAGLLEISFHDNLKEAKWIHDNINNIANAIAQGIVMALDIPTKERTFEQCIEDLQRAKIINTPEHWLEHPDPFIKILISNMAKYISKK